VIFNFLGVPFHERAFEYTTVGFVIASGFKGIEAGLFTGIGVAAFLFGEVFACLVGESWGGVGGGGFFGGFGFCSAECSGGREEKGRSKGGCGDVVCEGCLQKEFRVDGGAQ